MSDYSSFLINIIYFRYTVFNVQLVRFLSKPNGDGEIRTHDPLLARQVLSQLSYTPIGFSLFFFLISSPDKWA